MLMYQIIKGAIPDADDALCEYILWEKTSFPFGKLTAKILYKAASRVSRAHKNRIKLCDFCDNQTSGSDSVCRRCRSFVG